MSYFLGIDPGKKGGLCVLDNTGQIRECIVMPTEGTDISPHLLWNELDRFRRDYHGLRAWTERVNSREGSSGKAMFTFGKGFGYLVMAMVGLKIPFQMVPPSTWTKEMHKGLGKQYRDTKDRSLAMARRLWPDQTWLETDRCRKPHDGMYEAALIGEWARRNGPPQNVLSW